MATQYKPGDTVPHSGIYKVNHDRNHVQEHDVTCVYGKTFPPCAGCGKGVTFTLKYQAIHISSDPNFK